MYIVLGVFRKVVVNHQLKTMSEENLTELGYGNTVIFLGLMEATGTLK
jgi:hypothetical protein